MAKRKMKFKNGFGGISKLSGNRRRPFMAYITVGWKENETQIKKPIGYAETWEKAVEILINYHQNKYNIDCQNIKLKELYDKWEKTLEEKYTIGKISKSSYVNYKNSFKYYKSLWNEPFVDIRTSQIQNILDSCQKGYTTKNYIKLLYNKLYIYSVDTLDINIKKNYAENVDLGGSTISQIHNDFSEEEINILWDNQDDDEVKIVLIYCYTGLRPSELLKIKTENIFLEEKYMRGGIKTAAGKNRCIPLHNRIIPLIKYFYDKNNVYLLGNKIMTYSALNCLWERVMKKLKMNHLPHDGRVTFATRMDLAGANKERLKMILGHSTQDITDKSYIKKHLNILLEEVNKLK